MPYKRRICFIITSQIHYARSRELLRAIRIHPRLELQIAVAASAILPQYGDVLGAMKNDGINCNAKIIMTLAGGSVVAMAKTAGIGVTEFATAFDNMSPDVVMIRGDRYEVLAAAIAASYMNIPVAHMEGGDLSGSIDESVRHAVTKLSHIHFVTNKESAKRVRQMGENPKYIFDVGSPELASIAAHNTLINSKELNVYGVGSVLNIEKPFLIVMMHPVTTEKNNREKTTVLLKAINATNMQTVWFWPNVDAGTDDVAKAIRTFRENGQPEHMHFIKYLQSDIFIALLKKCACLVGNSSAGIKECSFLGIPAVNIGDRQEGRLRGPNVTDAGYKAAEIQKAIEKQVRKGKYPASDIYFKKDCIKRITGTLASAPLYAQKKFYNL